MYMYVSLAGHGRGINSSTTVHIIACAGSRLSSNCVYCTHVCIAGVSVLERG